MLWWCVSGTTIADLCLELHSGSAVDRVGRECRLERIYLTDGEVDDEITPAIWVVGVM
jgi:hypothetical protein